MASNNLNAGTPMSRPSSGHRKRVTILVNHGQTIRDQTGTLGMKNGEHLTDKLQAHQAEHINQSARHPNTTESLSCTVISQRTSRPTHLNTSTFSKPSSPAQSRAQENQHRRLSSFHSTLRPTNRLRTWPCDPCSASKSRDESKPAPHFDRASRARYVRCANLLFFY